MTHCMKYSAHLTHLPANKPEGHCLRSQTASHEPMCFLTPSATHQAKTLLLPDPMHIHTHTHTCMQSNMILSFWPGGEEKKLFAASHGS